MQRYEFKDKEVQLEGLSLIEANMKVSKEVESRAMKLVDKEK